MLIETLIEQLQKLPKETNVCIYDHRKNMGDDIGDGSSAGIYPNFEISLMELEPDEIEFIKEQQDRDFLPWVAISFDNDDWFGIAYNKEQYETFQKIGKIYVHLYLDSNCQYPALHPVNQKKLATLISVDKLKHIGFCD